jgi:hypothetical protein
MSCNTKYSDSISCIAGRCLLFADILFRVFFTDVHQKFLWSVHSLLPCNRDFALIEKNKKCSCNVVPATWKYIFVESGISKLFTVEVEQPHFKGSWSCWNYIEVVPKHKNHPGADVPAALHVRKNLNIMQPFEWYSVMEPRRGNHTHQPSAPVCKLQNLPVLYSAMWYF